MTQSSHPARRRPAPPKSGRFVESVACSGTSSVRWFGHRQGLRRRWRCRYYPSCSTDVGRSVDVVLDGVATPQLLTLGGGEPGGGGAPVLVEHGDMVVDDLGSLGPAEVVDVGAGKTDREPGRACAVPGPGRSATSA